MNSYNVPRIQHVYRWYKPFPNGWFTVYVFFPTLNLMVRYVISKYLPPPFRLPNWVPFGPRHPFIQGWNLKQNARLFRGPGYLYVYVYVYVNYMILHYSILRHTIKYPHGSLIAVPVFRKNIIRFAHVHIRLNRTYWIILGCHLI